MKDVRQIERYRNYSSVFTRRNFNAIMKYNDYSYMDQLIKWYDKIEVGEKFLSYRDYIEYVYQQMQKSYRNEYFYKNILLNKLILKQYKASETVVINEFKVGKSIADIAMFNGKSVVYEIKTELDSSLRLSSQLSDYRKVFDECYIVTDESLVDKYLDADRYAGVIKLKAKGRGFVLEEVRHSVNNNEFDAETVMGTLHTDEYIKIVEQYYKEVPQVGDFDIYNECKKLIKKIPMVDLKSLFLTQIKSRKTNFDVLRESPKELKQIILSLRFNNRNYNTLIKKLNKSISLN